MTKRQAKAVTPAAAKASAAPSDPNRLDVVIPPDGDKEKALAASGLDPVVKASALSNALIGSLLGTNSISANVRALRESVAKVQAGDMGQADAMMVAQAYTLDSLFADCLRRWQLNIGNNFDVSDRYLHQALKAQAQCRATWQAISEVHNPPGSATFVRQANIANGPQQVNNGPAALPQPQPQPASACVAIAHEQNELLGVSTHGLDTRAQGAAIGGDTTLAPVGKRNRAKVARR